MIKENNVKLCARYKSNSMKNKDIQNKEIIKSLHFKDYCNFIGQHTICFAAPDYKANGSGLSLITGANNTGKSSIIKALVADTINIGLTFTDYLLYGSEIKLTTDKGVYSTINKNNDALSPAKTYANLPKVSLVPSNRQYKMESHGLDSLIYLENPKYDQINNIYPLGDLLNKLFKDKIKEVEFYRIIKSILPEYSGKFSFQNVDNRKYKTLVYTTSNNIEYSARLLSPGLLSVIAMAEAMISSEDTGILIIDEPELYLSPAAQKKTSQLLSVKSKTIQVILVTHSPYFVNWSDLKNKAKFTRITLGENKTSLVNQVSDEVFKKILNLTDKQPRSPHFLDIVSKELFWYEKVLFLEGQEDVGILRKWLSDKKREIPFEIFGYGVGGVDNTSKFLDLVKELGFKQVAVLTDKLEDEKNILKDWGEKNAPYNKNDSYMYKSISTDDIRDKWDVDIPKLKKILQNDSINKEKIQSCIKTKIGLFDEEGMAKDDSTTELNKIFDQLNTFFK